MEEIEEMELKKGFGSATGEARGGGVSIPGARRTEYTFPLWVRVTFCFSAFSFLVVGDPTMTG